jgi:hypothetical protein
MAPRLTFSQWVNDVDTLCRHHLACSWQDLCGDEPPLRRGYEAGDAPIEFVRWWAEKYELTVLCPLPIDATTRR